MPYVYVVVLYEEQQEVALGSVAHVGHHGPGFEEADTFPVEVAAEVYLRGDGPEGVQETPLAPVPS